MSPFLHPRPSSTPSTSQPSTIAPPAAPTAVVPAAAASHFGSPPSSCARVTLPVPLAGMEVAQAGQLWGSVWVARPPWPHTLTLGHTATCLLTLWTSVTLNYSNFSSLKSPRCFLEAVGTLMPCEPRFDLELGRGVRFYYQRHCANLVSWGNSYEKEYLNGKKALGQTLI